MSESRSSIVEQLFHQAAELPPRQRRRFLDDHCGSDALLRAELERLLHHDAAAGDRFMRSWGPVA